MKVRMIQLLCPARHCMMAVVYESPDGEPDPAKTVAFLDALALMYEKKIVNPWCGLCQSRTLTPEDKPTKFATLAEARPHLQEQERQQAIVREAVEATRRAARN